MRTYVEKKKDSKTCHALSTTKKDCHQLQIIDNRPESLNQRKLKNLINGSAIQLKQNVVQFAPSEELLKILEEVSEIENNLKERNYFKDTKTKNLKEREEIERYLNKIRKCTKNLHKLKEDKDGKILQKEINKKIMSLRINLLPTAKISQPPHNFLCSLYSPAAAIEASYNTIPEKDMKEIIAKESGRSGGAPDEFFNSYFGTPGCTYAGYQDKWQKILLEAYAWSLPICIGVEWSRKEGKNTLTGKHWLYLSGIINNVIYARDQQNDHMFAIIAMDSWTGTSTSLGFQYKVTQISIGCKNEKQHDAIDEMKFNLFHLSEGKKKEEQKKEPRTDTYLIGPRPTMRIRRIRPVEPPKFKKTRIKKETKKKDWR